jgi:hypothetical protein
VTSIDKRIAAIEAALADVFEVDRRPAHELTDAECVLEWHRLCHQRPCGEPRQEPISDRERDAILEAWRWLRGRPRRSSARSPR